MKIEFLGTGGPVPIPRFGCGCNKCAEAREKGIPYSRGGPSVFVHGPDILIDTPEDIHGLLERSSVKTIGAGLYSHWHPDHVMGRRIWEIVNMDWDNYPPKTPCTPIYLPRKVYEDFRGTLGTGEHFDYLEKIGVVKLNILEDGQALNINGVTISVIPLKVDYSFGYLFEKNGRRALIVMDEVNLWEPPDYLKGVDAAVIQSGLMELNPVTGERNITAGHPILKQEALFDDNIEILRKLSPKRGLFTHIEGFITNTEQDILCRKYQAEGLNVEFAYDTQIIEL